MKIILMGNNAAAIRCYEVLCDEPICKIMVVTPHGGKLHTWQQSLFEHVQEKGLHPVFDPERVNSGAFIQRIRSFAPDVLFSVYFDQILSSEILSVPRIAAVNFHPSLLPKYRGVAPLIWAIIRGEDETGITAHFMEPTVDTGDIVAQIRIPISETDTGFDLHQKTAQSMQVIFREVWSRVRTGRIPRTHQSGEPSLYTRGTPQKNNLNWHQTSRQIYDIVRALTYPLPGAYSFWGRTKIIFLNVHPADERSLPAHVDSKTGRLFIDDNRKVHVTTGSGAVALGQIGVDNQIIPASKYFAATLNKYSLQRLCDKPIDGQ